MIEHKIIIHNNSFIDKARDYISNLKINKDELFEVVVKQHKSKRSLNQNALYWKWLGLMAKHFSAKHGTFTNDHMHKLMRHKFLGYEDELIGNTEIKGQLKSTKELNAQGMSKYMQEINSWSCDLGLLLPSPTDAEYEDLMKY